MRIATAASDRPRDCEITLKISAGFKLNFQIKPATLFSFLTCNRGNIRDSTLVKFASSNVSLLERVPGSLRIERVYLLRRSHPCYTARFINSVAMVVKSVFSCGINNVGLNGLRS